MNLIDLDIENAAFYERRLIKRNVVDYLNWLVLQKKLTSKEEQNLSAMINSPDDENFNLAIEIIQLKKSNQNGNNIHSGNAHV